MRRTQPRGFSRRRVQQLLLAAHCNHSVGSRIDFLSGYFLGRSYQPNPLIGSAETAEVFTASLDGFDCVTYIETVVALARASNVDGFTEELRRIRYEGGCIQWERRNHYMTAWLRNNVRNRIVRPLSIPAILTVSRERVLNIILGLPARRTRVECVPKPAVPRLTSHLQSGDLMLFVSTRRNLDVFHAGIIVRIGKNVLLRHASRSQGLVVEQELSMFLRANRMTGVIAARPQKARRRGAGANH